MPEEPSSVPASAAGGLSRRLGFLLAQLGTHAHRRFAERLARLDLHPRHFGMLSHLGASEGQSQQALSVALGIHRSAVVALVDDLEHRGLAERRRDPVDRRAYTLYLTPAGRDLLTDLERVADERDVELLSALDASERSQLISLLRRVAESQGLAAGVHPNLEPPEGDDRAEASGPAEGRVIGPRRLRSSFRQPEPNVGASAGGGYGRRCPRRAALAMAVTIARPSPAPARAGRAVAAEALEGSLEEFGVEAGAAVEHVQLDRLAVALGAQLDVSRSVTQRFRDQVVERLSETIGIGWHHRVRGAVASHEHAPARRRRPPRVRAPAASVSRSPPPAARGSSGRRPWSARASTSRSLAMRSSRRASWSAEAIASRRVVGVALSAQRQLELGAQRRQRRA